MAKSLENGPEFSRLLPLEAIGEGEATHCIEATAQERRALARRLGLAGISQLSAALRVWRPGSGAIIHLRGCLTGRLTQICVATLVELPVHLQEAFAQDFSLSQEDRAPLEIDVEGDEPPEAVGPDGLDLGEAVVQSLAASLDPYPRAAGARLAQSSWGGESGQKDSPFAALKALKDDP